MSSSLGRSHCTGSIGSGLVAKYWSQARAASQHLPQVEDRPSAAKVTLEDVALHVHALPDRHPAVRLEPRRQLLRGCNSGHTADGGPTCGNATTAGASRLPAEGGPKRSQTQIPL